MAKKHAFGLTVGGLSELGADMDTINKLLPSVMRDMLRGDVGEELLNEVRSRARDHIDSGYFLSQLEISDSADGSVEIGIPQDKRKKKHPAHPRASLGSIGTWLESGTKMHMIPTRVSKNNKMRFNGSIVSRVAHPGTKRYKVMGTSLRVVRHDAERVLVREIEKRLERKLGKR